MGQSTFRGGAHPYEGKELTMDYPVVKLEPGQELVFPMSQHIEIGRASCRERV